MAEVTGMTPDKIAQEISNVKSYVDGGLSEKADKNQVTSDLSKKANTTYVDSELSKKADVTYVDSLSPLKSFAGSGSPEGKVTAPVGSIYTDSAAINGAIRWIKKSGTGNTGWRVEYGDTGWREITGLLLNGWAATAIYIRRINHNVILRYTGLAGDNASSPRMIQLSTGFYTPRSRLAFTGNGEIFTSQFTSSGELDIVTSFIVPANIYHSETTWVTAVDWPSSLPGTPS